MIDRVLIPLDGSKTAEIALPYAIEIADKLNCQIHLVKVSETSSRDSANSNQAYLENVSERIKIKIAERGTSKTPAVYQKVLSGKPANQILRYGDDYNISLIIMSRHGASDDEQWFLGSIADKVLRAANQPLFLVKKAPKTSALKETSLINKILLPLDGSKIGEAAISIATGLANSFDAELVLKRAVVKSSIQRESFHGYIDEVLEEMIEQAKKGEEDRKTAASKYLEEFEEQLKNRGLKVSSEAVMGFASDQIVDYAETKEIDIIAMSSHGRTGITRWVLGSVTDKILRTGDTPVLVVRAGKP